MTQRVSNKAVPAGVRGWRLAPSLVPQPLWLLDAGAGLASFACQALVLNDGQLSVVPPLFVTELIFALLVMGFDEDGAGEAEQAVGGREHADYANRQSIQNLAYKTHRKALRVPQRCE